MAGIRRAIEWIAENDEASIESADEMESLISVLLVADLFGRDPSEIADRVIRARRRLGIIGPATVRKKR